jgi:hypothetical protein
LLNFNTIIVAHILLNVKQLVSSATTEKHDRPIPENGLNKALEVRSPYKRYSVVGKCQNYTGRIQGLLSRDINRVRWSGDRHPASKA